MKKSFFSILAFAIALLVCNFTVVFCDSSIVSEILKMHESGLNEETILMYFQSYNTEIELTSEDLIRLKNAGFSEEFIQALLQMRKMPDYDIAPHMYDYGSSYFSYSLGFNYACVQNAPQKSYFYSGGHAYIRHNGHFHIDDDHRFQSMANVNQLPERAFIRPRSALINRSTASFKSVPVKNHWSVTKSGISSKSTWGSKTSTKSSRPAGSFHGFRSSRAAGKIGFSDTKASNK
jgi:hypothetical protein